MESAAVNSTTQIRFDFGRGVTFIVTPLTAIAQNAMRAQSLRMANFPDPAAFEQTIENAFDTEAATSSAANNPEYLALVREARHRQDTIFWNLIIDVAVTVEDRDSINAQYATQVKALRAALTDATLSKDTASSDWALVVVGFLADESEVQKLIDAAQGRLPISESELRGGFRVFR